MGQDGLNLGLVSLFELDDGASCEGGEHGYRQPLRDTCAKKLVVISSAKGTGALVW